tara:strand:- start:1040 stop:1297 length:258 start_codon:yes stop_codon:yes gene_type:complete
MRNYSITKSGNEWFNVVVVDSFGVDHQNYFETQEESEKWVYYIFENEKPPLTKDQKMDMLATAIWGCTKLDEKLGLLKGNADNLD